MFIDQSHKDVASILQSKKNGEAFKNIDCIDELPYQEEEQGISSQPYTKLKAESSINFPTPLKDSKRNLKRENSLNPSAYRKQATKGLSDENGYLKIPLFTKTVSNVQKMSSITNTMTPSHSRNLSQRGERANSSKKTKILKSASNIENTPTSRFNNRPQLGSYRVMRRDTRRPRIFAERLEGLKSMVDETKLQEAQRNIVNDLVLKNPCDLKTKFKMLDKVCLN